MTKLWKWMESAWLVLHKILLQLFLETPKGKSGEYFRGKKNVIEYLRLPGFFHRSVSTPKRSQSFFGLSVSSLLLFQDRNELWYYRLLF